MDVGREDAPPCPPAPGSTPAVHPTPSAAEATIVEDDQQLYDWGIENRLDQYYQSASATESHGGANNNYLAQSQPPAEAYLVTEAGGHALAFPAAMHAMRPPHSHYPPSLPPRPPLPPHSPAFPSGPGAVAHMKLEESENFYSHPHLPRSSGGRRPVLPPVDMDVNEVLKVERKRARNRVAASRCRLRKLERIAVLDDQAKQLRAENEELAAVADKLRAQVYGLKQELSWHINNGCQLSHKDSAHNNNNRGSAVKKEVV